MSKKSKEFSELTLEELLARKLNLKEEAFNIKLQKESGQLENPSRIKTIRRDLARVETFISKNRLESNSKKY